MNATIENRLYTLARVVMAGAPDPIAQEFASVFPKSVGDSVWDAEIGVPDLVLPEIADEMPGPCQELCAVFLKYYDQLVWAPEKSWELGESPKIGGWLSIASATGPVVLEDRLVAFTVLNPRAYYPLHRHKPEEIYLTVAGGFWLHHPNEEPVWVSPGDTVYNASFQPHALTGGEASTLMIAAWRDGSFEPSEILE